MNMIDGQNNREGYVLLLSVLVLTAIGVLVSVATLRFGIYSSGNSLDLINSNKAKGVVNACGEEALLAIQQNLSFTGTVFLNLYDGTCEYVVSDAGSGKNILVEAEVNGVFRKLEIEVDQLTPNINVASWQEIN